ncbi:MAG: hypothetical protein JSW54_00390 [Fidelibacterota bacterium]|nr:MAG: hypothetical protein JSW54_00390 [Candidatus Neomarinimicrobiota bacterium]
MLWKKAKPKKKQPVRSVTGRSPAAQAVQKLPASTREVRGAVEVTSDPYLAKLSPEARAQLEVQEKQMEAVRKFVEENPEEASQLLRVWLAQGKEQKG